jgi:hypothetical protein
MKFNVTVLTKRGGVRIRQVTAPSPKAASAHVLRSMKRGDDRVLRVENA